jgi:hypothetical protein
MIQFLDTVDIIGGWGFAGAGGNLADHNIEIKGLTRMVSNDTRCQFDAQHLDPIFV